MNNIYCIKELQLRLKDMLEDNVDEKYYLKESTLKNYNRKFLLSK